MLRVGKFMTSEGVPATNHGLRALIDANPRQLKSKLFGVAISRSARLLRNAAPRHNYSQHDTEDYPYASPFN